TQITLQCKEQGRWLDELEFPHTLNPRMRLGLNLLVKEERREQPGLIPFSEASSSQSDPHFNDPEASSQGGLDGDGAVMSSQAEVRVKTRTSNGNQQQANRRNGNEWGGDEMVEVGGDDADGGGGEMIDDGGVPPTQETNMGGGGRGAVAN